MFPWQTGNENFVVNFFFSFKKIFLKIYCLESLPLCFIVSKISLHFVPPPPPPLGKTTLADSLVASNGIISQRQAGKVSEPFMVCATEKNVRVVQQVTLELLLSLSLSPFLSLSLSLSLPFSVSLSTAPLHGQPGG